MTYTGTRADCRRIAALQNKTAGYPLRGVRINGGIHGPMPDELPPGWDVTQPVPPGWTGYADGAIEPDRTEFAIPLDPTLENPDLVAARLTTAEQTELTTIRARGTTTEATAEERVR